jgi:LysM repeat protein
LSVAVAAAAPLVPHQAAVVPEPAVDEAHVQHATLAVPAAHVRRAAPGTYTVRAGDTLSAIAGSLCGDPGDYLALAYNNQVANPDLIYAGQVFRAACQAAAQAVAGRYALPPSSPPARRYTAPAARATETLGAGTYHGDSGMQACIIARESGGNSQVTNSSGHYGLYQFSEQTWAAHGGNPADFGHASIAEQNQVYAQTVHDDGYSDWSQYDGC